MRLRGLQLQQRVESSAWGRGLLSAFVVFAVLAMALSQMPPSHLNATQARFTGPFLVATGLDQDWSVFAPDPARSVILLNARIVYPDGRQEIWRTPRGNSLFGGYWDYRWLKWQEIVSQNPAAWAWRDFAAWIARHRARQEVQPSRVELYRVFYDLYPPGPGSDRGPTKRFTFYVDRLGRRDRSGATA